MKTKKFLIKYKFKNTKDNRFKKGVDVIYEKDKETAKNYFMRYYVEGLIVKNIKIKEYEFE